jgi:hypothetical protein
MRRTVAALLLAFPAAASALEGGVSLGGSLKIDDPLFGNQANAIDHLGAYLRLATHWRVGLEGLYRKSRDMERTGIPRLLAPGASTTATTKRVAESGGLTLDYGYRFYERHELGAGAAAGLQRIRYEHGADDQADGRYYAFQVYYDFFVTPRLSVGLSGRQQTDRVKVEPPLWRCTMNCTGINNVVYNPYAGLGLPGSYKARSDTLSLNLGFAF